MENPYWRFEFAEDYSSKWHILKCSGSWEVDVEPVSQASQALKVIENVRKISTTVGFNKAQWAYIADRFIVIAEGLMIMGLDKNFRGGKPLDGGRSSKDYPGLDKLLTVLRKGEALVSSCGTDRLSEGWMMRTEYREAFLEIGLELDTLNSQFHFEGSHGKYVELASGGVDRSDLLTEDAEKGLKEFAKNLLTRIHKEQESQRVSNLDLETLQRVVEWINPVGADDLSIYRKIDKDGWAPVPDGRWLGCEFATKVIFTNETNMAIQVFKSGDQSERNRDQLAKAVGALIELRHPHVIRLVGFGQGSEQYFFLMEKMDADLRNFMKRKLEPTSRPKPGPFSRSEELDIITQIAKGMYYLHTQQYVHADLKCSNILVKESGGYLEVKIADPRSAMKLGGDWDQAAFEIACSTRRPRWTAPEAIKHFGGTRPSSESLRKVDAYSFAMTCYEVVTGKYPFDGIRDDRLLEQIEAGVRPDLPGELDDDLKGVITSCWDSDPNKRPNFQSICHDLRSKQSAVGIDKSSRKDGVLGLFQRIPQNRRSFVLRGRVRKNANPPAIESSTWDDQKKAHEWQLSNSTIPFAEHLGILIWVASDAEKTVVDGDGENESERIKTRTRDWSAEETCTMLEFTEEALTVDVVPIWDFVSENLWDKCGFDRSSNSCENLWNSLLHSYKATQDDESKIRACTDLDLECREIIERILASKSFEEKTRSVQTAADCPSSRNDLPFRQFQFSGSEVEVLHNDSWTTGRLEDGMGLFGLGDEVLRDDLTNEDTCSSEYQGLSGDKTGTNQSHAEVTMDSHVSRITESHDETNANFAGRKRSAATVMEDELITRMAPFVTKQIEDALKPLISVLRGRAEDEQKYRQKLLVLEEEKLALKRQKMLFTHRGTTFEYNH